MCTYDICTNIKVIFGIDFINEADFLIKDYENKSCSNFIYNKDYYIFMHGYYVRFVFFPNYRSFLHAHIRLR